MQPKSRSADAASEAEVESRKDLSARWTKAHGSIDAYVRSVVRDHHVADDIVQEVARTVAAKFGSYDASKPFLNWAIGIARYEILSNRRSLARSRLVFSETALLNLSLEFERLHAESDRRRDALRDCMALVTGRRRVVLDMRYQKDLAIGDIAERLGVSSNSVALMLHRVRIALKECIEQRLRVAEHC